MARESRELFASMVSWDEKRPITVDLLKRLNISRLADYLGRSDEYEYYSVGETNPVRIAQPGAA